MGDNMFLQMLLNRFDVKGFLVHDLLGEALSKKLDEIVASTDNTLDDTLKQIIYPQLMAVIESKVDEVLAKVQPAE